MAKMFTIRLRNSGSDNIHSDYLQETKELIRIVVANITEDCENMSGKQHFKTPVLIVDEQSTQLTLSYFAQLRVRHIARWE